jgi:phenylalanyl-tRNA synthetase beta chain
MDIKTTHSLLKQYLDTKATPRQISDCLSLCGPTVERLEKKGNDYIYDLEIITNRIDSASAFGVAREAAAILPQFNIKADLISDPAKTLSLLKSQIANQKPTPIQDQIKVIIKDKNLAPRFSAIIIDNLKVKDSPKEVCKMLENLDQRPLNNLIDITNELTIKFGQPCHIFNFDKIKGSTLVLRESKKGEQITTLDGKKHTLKGADIVIEDGQGRLIDLCGIMGGDLSKVDQNTKRALLFVQTYQPKHIRTTSLYTNERTLAAQIFEKSPDPEMVLPVLAEGVKLLLQRAGGNIASTILDIYEGRKQPQEITLNLAWLNRFTGVTINPSQVKTILKDLGFSIKLKKEDLLVTPPSYRDNDITIKQDLAEEIMRVYGLHKLPDRLPVTNLPAESAGILTQTEPLLGWEYKTRLFLSDIGFTEIYNLSLVGKKLFKKANLPIDPSVKIKNPLSQDQAYMRRSLIPSNLQVLEDNRGKAELPLRIFELSNIYLPSGSAGLPDEHPILTINTQGDDYRHAKGYLETLLKHLQIKEIVFEAMTEDSSIFNKDKTAHIYYKNHYLGLIGEVKDSIKINFQLDPQTPVVISNLDFVEVAEHASNIHHFTRISPSSDIIEDININSDKPIGDLLHLIKQQKYIVKAIYLNSHQKNHTFRIHFNNPSKQLDQAEVNEIKTNLLSIL